MKGDVYTQGDHDIVVGHNVSVNMSNMKGHFDSKMHIKSLVNRENDGEQPVGDDIPVITVWNDGEVIYDMTDHIIWRIDDASQHVENIISWTPDIDALIKMQTKHDATDINKIVDAVNYLRGELTADNCMFWNRGENALHSSNGVRKILALEPTKGAICTIEQFNHCVKTLTGNPKEHLAWLTALNDMRADQSAIAQIQEFLPIVNALLGGACSANEYILITLQNAGLLRKLGEK